MPETSELPSQEGRPEFDALVDKLQRQRPDADVEKLRAAFAVAQRAHAGQLRESGEPYIIHPVAVADILVDLRMDEDAIAAALLHDVLEDSGEFTRANLAERFGADVLSMVEGVTKLAQESKAESTDRERAAAKSIRNTESLRKMILAMASDFRVMVIKLADRLHNVMTLDATAPEKRARVANETLEVYAPLAGRLGIYQIKWQLEDLCFKALHPQEFKRVSDLVGNSRQQREEQLDLIIETLRKGCEGKGVGILDIAGRPKHLFSIFNKMVKGDIPFEEIFDLLAVRVIVESDNDCYLALSVVNETFVPIPGLMYDYIARPKPNGYQSLHQKVLGPHGRPVEIQIRTRDMHERAEYGVAAHWTYKEGRINVAEVKELGQLREQIRDWSNDSNVSSDFKRNMETDLFSEQVFVNTPRGEVIELPAGSTVIDFAFRVHTQLGLTLIGARVNGAMVPLSTRLKSGDVVELITRSNAVPSLDWLEHVRSPHTRAKLRAYFRKQSKDADASRGRDMLDKELRSMGLDPKQYLGEDRLKVAAEHFDSCETGADLLAKVGTGLASVQNVVAKLRGSAGESAHTPKIALTKSKEGKLHLSGDHGSVLVNRAKCCDPIPGEEVVGYVTRGRGIMVHRRVCANVQSFVATEPERLIPYDWPPDGNVYPVSLRVIAANRHGLLMDISTIFGETKTNVSRMNVSTLPNATAELDITLDVADLSQLSYLVTRISNFADVFSVLRHAGRARK